MITTLIMFIVTGAFFRSACTNKETEQALHTAEPKNTESLEAEALLETELSPSALVHWSVRCLKCGHIYEYDSNEGVVGLTRHELETRFPEWSIAAFSREYAQLTREHDGWCPEHHLIFLEGDMLTVYSIVEPELTMEKLLDFSAEPFDLGPAERSLLKNGIAFSTLKELDDYTRRYKKEG